MPSKLSRPGADTSIIAVVLAILLVLCGTLAFGDSLSEVAADSSTLSEEDTSAVAAGVESEVPAGDDVMAYPMSAERKERLIDYSRFNNIWRFVSFLLEIAILALILFTGFSARMRNWAQVARKKFLVLWLFFVMFVVVDYLLNLPFSIYRSFVVESNYGFMNQTFGEWFSDDLLGLLITMVVGIVPVWFLYWLIGKFRNWWLVFSVGAIPFAILMIVIVPVLVSPMFNEFEPIKDKALETEISTLADKAGIVGADIFQVDGSKQSSKINAYVTGMFGSKRIVLYDTMIKNFTTEEIKFVMGHEMGHYVMQHIWWGLGVAIVFIAFILWLMSRILPAVITRFKGPLKFDKLSDMASLPLIMIFVSVASFIFQPVTSSSSRYMERQSDRYGMDISGVSGEAAAIAFDKLSVYNLSDPDPHPLIEFWFYSHPALKKRMEFVRTYGQ